MVTRQQWSEFDIAWAAAHNGRGAIRDWQIARCRKDAGGCNRNWAWPRGSVLIRDAYCPDCSKKLYQTTLLVGNGRAYWHFVPVGEVGRLQQKIQAPGVEKKVIDDLMDGRVLKALEKDHEREGMTINEVDCIVHLGAEQVERILQRLVRGGWVRTHIGTTVRYMDPTHPGVRLAVPNREGTRYYTLDRIMRLEGGQ